MSDYVNVDQLKFLLKNVHQFSEVLDYPRYNDYDQESIEMLIDSSKELADKEIFPYLKELDEFGVKYQDGEITVHPQVGKAIKVFGENGYIATHFDYDEGGMQLPHMANIVLKYIFSSADNSILGYPGLTAGAADLIRTFGSKELFETYVPKMLSGDWQGTMALTEPQAGSSLSDIVTSAEPIDEQTYKIEGQKIFISAGDHNYCENVVHLLLARIKGAPKGTKGISLFVVPKYRIEGNKLESNDVFCAGEFRKMGQRGYATTHLVFGENRDCIGYLVGQPHQGLKYMFKMMNAARIDVGLTANSIASAAYHKSLQYAKERPQGRRLTNGGAKDINLGQVTIIEHPDVRRMLLLQRAIVDGAISLAVMCGECLDISHNDPDDTKRAEALLLLEILTPITKTYPSEMGRVSVSNGLQIFGGYGFTTDFPLEQYYRDIRICALYEGTTGIQSLDLLGRKVTMQNGKALSILEREMKKTMAEAMTIDDLKKYAEQFADKLKLTQEILENLLVYAFDGNHERFLSDANIFMEYLSTVVIAWQWLKMGVAAKRALIMGNTDFNPEFYQGQIHTMKFYFKYELPKTLALAETLKNSEALTIMQEEEKLFV